VGRSQFSEDDRSERREMINTLQALLRIAPIPLTTGRLEELAQLCANLIEVIEEA
jgi:hypothetical protein